MQRVDWNLHDVNNYLATSHFESMCQIWSGLKRCAVVLLSDSEYSGVQPQPFLPWPRVIHFFSNFANIARAQFIAKQTSVCVRSNVSRCRQSELAEVNRFRIARQRAGLLPLGRDGDGWNRWVGCLWRKT